MAAIGYMAAAAVLGILVAFQPMMNAVLARAIGSAYGAATISILVAALGAILMVLLTGAGEMNRATLATVPWWVFLAGFVGTVFVAGGVVIAPVIGGLLFFACVIAGQLLGATLADHLGLFGLEVRQVSPARLIGIALVVAGALVAQRG
jgi:transporter family-2 protein